MKGIILAGESVNHYYAANDGFRAWRDDLGLAATRAEIAPASVSHL